MDAITIETLMEQSGVKFGTSGARGLVTDMTDKVCYLYTLAFLQHLQATEQLYETEQVMIAGDLRPSTPRIMAACSKAISDFGLTPINTGLIPSPAVAYYAMQRKAPSLMVTGSHIPDDRNGIKFNTALGEIAKADEQGIKAQEIHFDPSLFAADGLFKTAIELPTKETAAQEMYLTRYTDFYADKALDGLTIGVYQHTSVARDLLVELFQSLGAKTIPLGRAKTFIPVDTEAVREEDIRLAKQWASQHQLDAIVTTDGDADRPLIADENGHWLRGDIITVLCAQSLGIKALATPVSSNSLVEKSAFFDAVERTKIGSPFVIEAMQNLSQEYAQVAGYEANGGFLLNDTIVQDGKSLLALPTRDAVIVMLALLTQIKQLQSPLSKIITTLPQRFTASDRIKEFPNHLSAKIINELSQPSIDELQSVLYGYCDSLPGQLTQCDLTDGVRMTFDDESVIHLRGSGNAPEFRCYTEADSATAAELLNRQCITKMLEWKEQAS